MSDTEKTRDNPRREEIKSADEDILIVDTEACEDVVLTGRGRQGRERPKNNVRIAEPYIQK